MKIENEINSIIENKLNDGTIEKIVSEKFEKCIQSLTESLFQSYGDIGKLISDKLKEVIVPAIEKSDFSKSLVKLDTILTEIINTTALQDNQKILENFKELMIEEERNSIKTSELFEIYCKHVAECVDTSGLDIIYEDSPCYESVRVSMQVEKQDSFSRDWECATIKFSCDEDEKLNCDAVLSRWPEFDKTDFWDIRTNGEINIKSLRYMNEFLVMINKISRSGCKIEIDEWELEEYVTPEEEPEPIYR